MQSPQSARADQQRQVINVDQFIGVRVGEQALWRAEDAQQMLSEFRLMQVHPAEDSVAHVKGVATMLSTGRGQ